MQKKRYIRTAVVLCVLLVSISMGCSLAERTSCEHSWTVFTEYADVFLTQEVEVQQYDSEMHAIVRSFPIEKCALCGEVRGQEHRASYMQIHSYKVDDWHFVNDGAGVEIQFGCHICGYELVEMAALQEILDGTNNLCLIGGECVDDYAGSMYPAGIEQTNGFRKDAHSFTGVVEVPCSDDRSHYYLAERSYCPVCGRPQMQIISMLDEGQRDEWGKWPCYDLPAFLSQNMPNNLPYQLIDSLRSQSIVP